ncbi:hypothetical protein [Streptomyces parvus]|uniref:hypothetical protein n=1 Tax=Streptomyces parvus TaxID=66428 RepID=UPI0035DE8EB0
MNERNSPRRPSGKWGSAGDAAKTTLGCLVALLVVVGIPGAGIYAFIQWSESKPVRQVAENLDDYDDLCYGRKIPGSRAYEPGAGPHPIAVFQDVAHDDSSQSQVSIRLGERDDPFNPEDPDEVQLVACTERIDAGEEVATCDFSSESVKMRSATAKITVYEARTREQVGESIELVGEDASCPGVVYFKGELSLYTIPSESQYVEALESVVTGSGNGS